MSLTTPVKVDVRIICATNKNLMNEVAAGNFREDLFHRLAIGVFKLPALRERRGDLNMLINHFIDEINCEFRRIHGSEWRDRILSANARNALAGHSWPGNIRELRNTLTRIILWTPDLTIRSKDVSDAIFADSVSNNGIRIDFDETKDFDLQKLLGSTALKYIETALEKTEGNKCKAAELLGFANYQTMDNWIKRYRKK